MFLWFIPCSVNLISFLGRYFVSFQSGSLLQKICSNYCLECFHIQAHPSSLLENCLVEDFFLLWTSVGSLWISSLFLSLWNLKHFYFYTHIFFYHFTIWFQPTWPIPATAEFLFPWHQKLFLMLLVTISGQTNIQKRNKMAHFKKYN